MNRPRPVVALLALALLAGCQRQPRFVPVAADSSAVPVDSFAVAVRTAQQCWDAGEGEEAARLTAHLVLSDLRMRLKDEPRTSWEERARTLLDSLDAGAELASAPCAMVVDLFARSNPEAGSWPWLYWCSGSEILAQPIEGNGMGLLAVASRGLFGAASSAAPQVPEGIAVLYGRRAAGGQQPVLMAWRAARGDRWELAQTLGPDSLGGVGAGEFRAVDDTTIVLTTRTWKATRGFDECATCPHVFVSHRFRWGLAGFERVEDRVRPSPYATFVQLIQAMTAGDRGSALRLVTDGSVLEQARRAEWNLVRGPWRAAPAADETAREMVFFRGATEAWKVRFDRRGEDWLVAGLSPTARAIE